MYPRRKVASAGFVEESLKHSIMLTAIVLVGGVLLGLWAYSPGLQSDLYLDSVKLYQLEQLYREKGADVSIGDFGFESGAGRVVSLGSFYLNILLNKGLDVGSIKFTNLLIHFLNTVLVFVLALQLLNHTVFQKRGMLLAGFVALIWLLSAVNLSSVVYAIQRMNQLATFFTLLALVYYLRFRPVIGERVLLSRDMLSLVGGVGVFTALAIGSKDNGALIPVLIVLCEFCFFPRKDRVWQGEDYGWRYLDWGWCWAASRLHGSLRPSGPTRKLTRLP